MTHVLVLLLALLIGVVAGLRAMTAPAVVAWAAFLRLDQPLRDVGAWVGHSITVTVLTILAVGELITDQLPKTPSRKTTVQFVTRLITGGVRRCGARDGVGLHVGQPRGGHRSAPCWARSAGTRPAPRLVRGQRRS